MLDAASPPPSNAYQALKSVFSRRHHLGEAMGVLGWDQRVMMPSGAAAARGETLAAMAQLRQETLLGERVAALLDAAEADHASQPEAWGRWDAANLRLMRRACRRAAAEPPELVAALTRAGAAGEAAWRDARAASDFAAFAPALAEVVRLTRESAAALSAALGLSPYEALMDAFEPGLREDRLSALFAPLEAALPEMLSDALERQAAAPTPPSPSGPFPVERQRALGLELMAALGFDFKRGRLDVSAHPFCGGADDDVRLTTRYDEADFSSALMGVLHETGHGLYEQGLPGPWRDQPVGRAGGLALHESQSLFIEMQLCRSAPFLAFAAPKIRAAFGADEGDPAYAPEALAAGAARVARGMIRVDADEVSYPLHVILRVRLERALLSGDLPVADLPAAWNDAMAALIGVRPANDAEGCLQDIHWADGAFGYFPTYTLGAMAAAQLKGAAARDLPDMDARVAAGDLAPVVAWLRQAVHERGALEDTDAVLTAATGAPLGPEAFLAHVRTRYLGR